MDRRTCALKDDRTLLVRPAAVEDADALLAYVEDVCAESPYLSFGPGEFGLGRAEEEAFIRDCLEADNRLCLLGCLEDAIAGVLVFRGGRTKRTRHSGELGMSVRRASWSLGIGAALLDTLIDWAGQSGVVTKINLRVRTDNGRAIHLYETRGFEIEGTIRREMHLYGRYHDHHWMGLQL